MQTTYPFPQAKPVGRRPAWRRWSRWLLIPLAAILLVGGGLWWRSSQTAATTTTTTAAVTQGDLAVTISGSGTVAAARTVAVPLQQAGTVTSVDVQVGDTVAAGQLLASIDASTLQRALAQAQANLTAAQASYNQLKSGSATEQDVASAQAQLDSAEAQLTQTKTGTATAADIQSAQAQLTAAQAQLAALKNPSAADLSAAQSKVDQAQIALESTRNSASQAKTNAQLALQNSTNALTQAQSKFATAQSNWQYVQDTGADPSNPTTTNSSGQKVKNKLSDTQRQAYYDTYVQAQAALDSAQNAVTQAQVAYDAARQSEVTQVQQAEASLKEAQDQLTALKNPSASDLAQAQAAVIQAQASLTKLKQGGTAAEVAQAQASVTQAQASLESLTAPATDSDLTAAQASVLQAQVAVATAQANLDAATLKAPFAGVVSAVSIVKDSTISAGASAVTLVDASTLHVELSLSETDAAKVKAGQPVALTFDALPDATLNGTVASVAPVATTEQNVVTYAVQVEFNPGTTAVKVGMSTTADIQIEQVTGALLVPTKAVQISGNSKSVTVQQGVNTVTVPVTTGITSNGKVAIASSGGDGVAALKAGDVVVVPGTATSSATTTSTTKSSTSLSGLTGAPSGPPPGQ